MTNYKLSRLLFKRNCCGLIKEQIFHSNICKMLTRYKRTRVSCVGGIIPDISSRYIEAGKQCKQQIRTSLDKKLEAEAEKLKRLCDHKGREIDLSKTTPILHKIGLLYEEKYDVTGVELDLIRCAGLLNAALIRDPDNKKIQQDLQKFCSQILVRAGAEQINANLMSISLKVVDQLKILREDTAKTLNSLPNIPFASEMTLEEVNMQLEKINRIFCLQIDVSRTYSDIMDYISQKCLKIMGKPPCQFTLVGMGSLARNEITPYSDFESIIVLEEGAQTKDNYDETLKYFRWYSVIFQVILVNLKETILRFLAIPCLNDDTKKGGDWFYDACTSCGVCPDGFAAHACKNPLGRQEHTKLKNWTTELIKPVSEMVKFLDEEEDLKNGYHLGDLLTKSCFVSGDEDVFGDFEELINKKLSENKSFNFIQTQEQICENLDVFHLLKRLTKFHLVNTFDIKRFIYRSVTIFISALGRIHMSDGTLSCFSIIGDLKFKHVINPTDAHLLSYAIAVACQVRLKTYTSKNSQEDRIGKDYFFNAVDQLAKKEPIDIVGEKSLVDYFQIATSLQEALEHQDANSKLTMMYPLYRTFQILQILGLHDQIISKWGGCKHKVLSDLNSAGMLIGDCVAFAYETKGLYQEALDLNMLLEESEVCGDKHPEIIENTKLRAAVNRAEILMIMERREDAVEHLESVKPKIAASNVSEAEKHSFYREIAKITNDYKWDLKSDAISASKEMLDHCEKDAEELDNDLIKVNAILRHAFNLIRQQNFQEALQSADEALKLCIRDKIQLELRGICYLVTGVSYFYLEDYKAAIDALTMHLVLVKKYAPQEQYEYNRKLETRLIDLIAICGSKYEGEQCAHFQNSLEIAKSSLTL